LPSSLPNRLELARRLHDGPAQQLVVIGLALDELVSNPLISKETRTALRNLRLQVIDTSKSLRSEIYTLRRLTFTDVKAEVAARLQNIVSEIELPKAILKPEIEDALSRSLIEIVRNCQRHSKANRFQIKSHKRRRTLEVLASDDGTGRIRNQQRSLGLKSITEPIIEIGGTVTLNTGSNGSTYQIEISLR
jgi:NarL family two-component system sensor histidine kinase LiaS